MGLSTFVLALCLFTTTCRSQKLIQSFRQCTELNNYYINKVLPLVGPSGLTSENAYTQTREPLPFDNPGKPGGPAGLPLNKPFSDPKFIESGNITNVDIFNQYDDDDDDKGETPDFSTANVQVRGVDEADIVKTDGSRVYTVAGRKFSVIKVLNEGGAGTLTGSIRLPTYPDDMLFEKDFVVVFGRDDTYKRPVNKRYIRDPSLGEDSTVLYQISVRNNQPRLIPTLHLEGTYVRARETDGVARIVIQFNPLNSIWLYTPTDKLNAAQTRKWNREIIQYSRSGNWLPTYRLRKGNQVQYGTYASCPDMYYSPSVFAGFSMLYVVTLPLNQLMSPTSSASIISDSDALYVTKKSMYVRTGEFRFGNLPTSAPRWGASYRTSIHKFDLTNQGATYAASGSIQGSVLNRFSLHEQRGFLFVAATQGASWWSGRSLSASKVTSFKLEKSTRTLRPIGTVGNLGLGERIFAVRYRGNIAYVVTFRETDPLYIIDLSRPWALEVKGELKVPGFSTFLHFVEPGRVLGVGKDIVNGAVSGTKVSLFDVSEETNPKELAVWSLQVSYSNAEWDNRAFLYWRRLRMAFMPIVVEEDGTEFSGAIVLHVTDKGIVEIGRIQHFIPGTDYHPRILRNLVIGKYLWSMSLQLLQINELANIGRKRDAVEIGDTAVIRVPTLFGLQLNVSYTWEADSFDLDTGTQFLTAKVGFGCPTGDQNGNYIRFSGDNTGDQGNEDATVLLGKALSNKQFNKTTDVEFNAGWYNNNFQGGATLTLTLVRRANGNVVPASEISLPITPGTSNSCSSTTVGILTVEVGAVTTLTLRTF